MGILTLLLMLALLGLVTWAIVSFIPMPAGIQKVIIIVAVIAAVLYALNAFGISIPNPRIR